MSMIHSDFSYKQPQQFENYSSEYVQPLKSEKVSDEEFERFAQNPLKQQMKERKLQNAANVFSEKYRVTHMSDSQLERNIVQKVEGIYERKSWAVLEKTKRVKNAKKMIANQQYLVEEENIVSKEYSKRSKHRKSRISKYHMDRINENYTDKTEREAVLTWMIGEKVDSDGDIVQNGFFEKMIETPLQGRKAVLDSIPKLFAKVDFSYRDDKSFIERYGEKHDLLCRIIAAEAFLNHIEKEDDLADYKATKAAIELAKEIREHYETKAKLIKSPYYVLTR